ncbi:MAG: patatin-like phospholipase family protein [Thermoanaerobaculales bacterium]|nr:patatin-like phospholipase family protein [Thermoanaerobaculales bacterium]
MATYRILSIDGGGIRGLVTTVLMQRLAATPGLEGFLERADLIAGTSTGGLLALGLARGLGLEEIRDLYVVDGPAIFDDSWLDDLVDLGKLRGADYKVAPLRRVLARVLGDATTLGELGRHVLITAFDLDNEHADPGQRSWKPKLFHNFEGPGNDRSELAARVGLYTAAAPTYFPSVDGFIDGGVYASNPSMCALAQTRGATHDWGYVQWAKPLISLMLDGSAGIADYQCSQMLRDRYHRLAPVFPSGVSIPMDAVAKIPDMIAFADKVPLRRTVDWLQATWMAD